MSIRIELPEKSGGVRLSRGTKVFAVNDETGDEIEIPEVMGINIKFDVDYIVTAQIEVANFDVNKLDGIDGILELPCDKD